MRDLSTRTRLAAQPATADRAAPKAARRRSCFRRSPESEPGRDAAIHTAPSPAICGRTVSRAGDDQRKSERRADRQPGTGFRAAGRPGGPILDPQPADPDRGRRFRHPRLPRPDGGAAAIARVRAGAHRPRPNRIGRSCHRRRTQEHLLPHHRALRHSQPAHRRPGELRDAGLLPRDARSHAALLPRASPGRGA